MRKLLLMSGLIAIMILAGSLPVAAGEWRIPFGVTYLNGASDLFDQMEDNLRTRYTWVDTVEGIPVGLTVQPYYEFDNGLGLGFGLVPVIYAYGDVDYFGLPVNVSLRYAFLPKTAITPYVRVGASMQIANGDFVKERNAGVIGAIGMELMRDRKVSLGIEVGYDTSSVELEDLATLDPNDTEEIEPAGFMVSIGAVF